MHHQTTKKPKTMKTLTTTQNKEKNNIIVSFHIGRGGQFWNAGHLSFIGEKNINDFTNDLFIEYENEREYLEKIGNRENLLNKYNECRDIDNFSWFEDKFGFDFGKKVYSCGNGCQVGLSVDNDGTGCINIDNDYDTTYAKFIDDCTEEELRLIKEYNYYKSNDLNNYIDNYFGTEE